MSRKPRKETFWWPKRSEIERCREWQKNGEVMESRIDQEDRCSMKNCLVNPKSKLIKRGERYWVAGSPKWMGHEECVDTFVRKWDANLPDNQWKESNKKLVIDPKPKPPEIKTQPAKAEDKPKPSDAKPSGKSQSDLLKEAMAIIDAPDEDGEDEIQIGKGLFLYKMDENNLPLGAIIIPPDIDDDEPTVTKAAEEKPPEKMKIDPKPKPPEKHTVPVDPIHQAESELERLKRENIELKIVNARMEGWREAMDMIMKNKDKLL